MKNDDNSDRFSELIKDIPKEIIQVTDDVINFAKGELQQELNEIIYITLLDHINYAVERYLNGIQPTNAMLWEIKRFYKKEMEIALSSVEIINSKLVIDLSEDEAGFIALHIVNAEMDGYIENVSRMTNIIQEILNIVKYHFKINFNEESLAYFRFVTHLKFFAQRLLNRTFDKKSDEILLNVIKDCYGSAYECVERIDKHILKTYEHKLTPLESTYLTLHIIRLLGE